MTNRILLIDAGNTRIKLGWVDTVTGQREAESAAIILGQTESLPTIAARLPKGFSGALGVSVATPHTVQALEHWLNQTGICSGPLQWLQSSECLLDVHNAYQPVEQLGADRWIAMLGLAWHERQREAAGDTEPTAHSDDRRTILATFGTATTIDTLAPKPTQSNEQKAYEFVGGLILPGVELMLTSLAQGTANLPMARAQEALYPTNTQQAIVSGVVGAQAGALLRQWQIAVAATGVAPRVYTSGGAWIAVSLEVQRVLQQAATLVGKQAEPLRFVPSPVLDGLACLARRSQQ